MSDSRAGQLHGETRAAVRVDPRSGIRETVQFLPTAGGDIFAATHLPPCPPTGGVMICPPLFGDFETNYRREVQLGRTLAHRGIAAQRFHYRGVGNSDGDAGGLSWDGLVADARSVIEPFLHDVGDAPLGFVGTRIGALVAAELATDRAGSPLALWEPTTDADRFLREGLRSQAMSDVVGGVGGTGPSTAALLEELQSKGFVNVLGYRLPRGLFASIQGRTLPGELGSTPRPILLVQFKRAEGLRREYAELADSLAAQGFAVETSMAGVAEAWWFHTERVLPVKALVERTADWLEQSLQAKVPAAP